jgi:hypothetical protein
MEKHRRGTDFLCNTTLEIFSLVAQKRVSGYEKVHFGGIVEIFYMN